MLFMLIKVDRLMIGEQLRTQMIHVVTPHTAIQTSDFEQVFATMFQPLGLNFTLIDSEQYEHFYQDNSHDVYVIEDHPNIDQLIGERTTYLEQQMGLSVLNIQLTDNLDDKLGEYSDQYDFVLPLIPHLITQQIRFWVKQHESNLKWQARVANLQDQVDGLESRLTRYEEEMGHTHKALVEQKRITSEIEILKNVIVNTVSHELKTPLLQVKSAVAMIAEELKGEENNLPEYALNATARLESHVKNITMLGTSLRINLGPIIIKETIDYAKRTVSRIWQHKNDASRITLDIEPNLPPVISDKHGLSTVLHLLLDNALKFSDADVTVEAKLVDDGQFVHVSVRDKGIGIAESEIGNIFESFYQVDGSTTRSYSGTGIGLAIVKIIMDHHQVPIHVESTVQQGTVFSFKLAIAHFDD